MARRPPPRNLPPSSEPWGRDVDQRLMDLETRQSAGSQATQNTLSSLNSGLIQLGNNLTTLAGTVAVVDGLFTVNGLDNLSLSTTGDKTPIDMTGDGGTAFPTAFLASGTVLSGTTGASAVVDLEVRGSGGGMPTFLLARLTFNLPGGGAGSWVEVSNVTPQPLNYSNNIVIPRVTTAGALSVALRVVAINI